MNVAGGLADRFARSIELDINQQTRKQGRYRLDRGHDFGRVGEKRHAAFVSNRGRPNPGRGTVRRRSGIGYQSESSAGGCSGSAGRCSSPASSRPRRG